MIRDICRDESFLAQKSVPATPAALPVAEDIGVVMFNPEIIQRTGPYQTEEGCLSLTGVRPAKRWKSIKVRWQNEKFQQRIKKFTGWTAQIIQHEIDHCDGIII